MVTSIDEQSREIRKIAQAIQSIDTATQMSAAAAEETSATVHEMEHQGRELDAVTEDLERMVGQG
jgi:methyl-accepting chemotaxis protein